MAKSFVQGWPGSKPNLSKVMGLTRLFSLMHCARFTPIVTGRSLRSARSARLTPNSSLGSSQASLGKRPPMFYAPDMGAVVAPGAVVVLSAEETKHATTVLRLKEGAVVQLCDGRGAVVGGVLEAVGGKRAGARVRVEGGTAGGRQTSAPGTTIDSGVRFHMGVACGSLKGSRGDWLVEKCAEIGARRMTPLVTARGREVGLRERHARYERLAVSVMKQSLQGWKMEVGEAVGLFDFVDGLDVRGGGGKTLVFVGAESAASFGDVLAGLRGVAGAGVGAREVVILVGPEGDFTPEELEGLLERGVMPVGVGEHRLRTETVREGWRVRVGFGFDVCLHTRSSVSLAMRSSQAAIVLLSAAKVVLQ